MTTAQKIHEVVRDLRMPLRYQAEVNRRAMETGAWEREFKFVPDPATPENPLSTLGTNPFFGNRKICSLDLPPHSAPFMRLRMIACNTIVFDAQFFDGFYDPKKHDVMCAYCQLKDGRWKVSLYSTKPEIDCGGISKTFGGSGHKGAAEFVCDKLPWELAS